MQNLIDFLEKETNKKVNIFKYNNQQLKNNQQLVNFNDTIYIFETSNKFDFQNMSGYFYLIYQPNSDFQSLKNVLCNLYDSLYVFEYEKYIIINCDDKLNINNSTIQIIESETYSNTYIASLGNINEFDIFNLRISIFKDFFDSYIDICNLHKFITLNDLVMYNYISLIKKDSSISNLLDLKKFSSLDDNLMNTGIHFIENDLNISKTSSALFLHRNTLIYRLEKIKENLGLDLKTFKDAFIFYITIKSYHKN